MLSIRAAVVLVIQVGPVINGNILLFRFISRKFSVLYVDGILIDQDYGLGLVLFLG